MDDSAMKIEMGVDDGRDSRRAFGDFRNQLGLLPTEHSQSLGQDGKKDW
jgi:hypothetical protein